MIAGGVLGRNCDERTTVTADQLHRSHVRYFPIVDQASGLRLVQCGREPGHAGNHVCRVGGERGELAYVWGVSS